MRQSDVLLTFETITNPVSLLYNLIVQRNLNSHLFVHKSSLTFYDEQNTDWGVSVKRELTDNNLPNDLDKYIPAFSQGLILQDSNLSLSIKILQFAISEGFINVISPEIDEKILETSFLSDNQVEELFKFNTIIFDYDDHWSISNGSYPYESKVINANNIKLSLDLGLNLPIDNRKQNQLFKINSIFKESKSEIIAEAILKTKYTDFDELKFLIDKPNILFQISNTIKEISERRNTEKEILVFLPKFVLDYFTFGAIGISEFLYKLIKRNQQKNS